MEHSASFTSGTIAMNQDSEDDMPLFNPTLCVMYRKPENLSDGAGSGGLFT